jgi:basic membrane lipoprotein Med (substrate-binding protein (PBP1-ABC) superfamily)
MNLTTFTPLLHQPANVCGLAAAFNTDTGKIGIVADPNMFNVSGVINAYIEGAKITINHNMETYVNYADSNDETTIRAAIDHLVENGNDVIMLYLATDYGIRYCEQIGVKFVAYSHDLPRLAPNYHVTGFFFNASSYVTEQVRFIQNGIFNPFRTVVGMDTGHTSLLGLNPTDDFLRPETWPLTDNLRRGVIASDKIFTGAIVDNSLESTVQVEHGVTLPYEEILRIRWLDISVGSRVVHFESAVDEIPIVELEIKQ